MRDTRTLAIALAAGAMLLATACSNNTEETEAAPTAKSETPGDMPSDPKAAPPVDTPSSAAPTDTPAQPAPAPKAPAN